MSLQRSHGALDLDSWLAELDHRLRAIQAELIPARAVEASPDVSDADAGTSVNAGPFSNTGTVRAFEHALAALPGVSEVTFRAYEGPTRAVFDVQLS